MEPILNGILILDKIKLQGILTSFFWTYLSPIGKATTLKGKNLFSEGEQIPHPKNCLKSTSQEHIFKKMVTLIT